jgi:hypothetical protein
MESFKQNNDLVKNQEPYVNKYFDYQLLSVAGKLPREIDLAKISMLDSQMQKIFQAKTTVYYKLQTMNCYISI